MGDKTTRNLPTLAHPLLVSPDQGAGAVRKKPRYLLPFPHIDLNWAGFSIPHLHWVGIKLAGKSPPYPLTQHVKLAILHEFWHGVLSTTPFLKIRNHEGLKLCALIRTTFEEGQEQISVPLNPKKPRNELEKEWERVVSLKRETALFEEVYVVRKSLLEARVEGLIESDWVLWRLREDYRAVYDKYIPGYAAVYNWFDFVARKIGETAADAMVRTALGTNDPQGAFLEILFYLCRIDHRVPTKVFIKKPSDEDLLWDLPPKETNFIKSLSYEQAHHYFTNFLDEVDPDDLRYEREMIQDIEKMLAIKPDNILSRYPKYVNDDLLGFVLGESVAALFSEYSHYIHSIEKVGDYEKGEIDEAVEDGNFTILIEAIMEQMTRGKGLLCPFWMWRKPPLCCSGHSRAFLEQVWSCTKPDASCESWERLGCLK